MWYPPPYVFGLAIWNFKELTLQISQFSQLVSGLFLLLFDIDNFLGSISINQNLQFTFFNMETLSQNPFSSSNSSFLFWQNPLNLLKGKPPLVLVFFSFVYLPVSLSNQLGIQFIYSVYLLGLVLLYYHFVFILKI